MSIADIMARYPMPSMTGSRADSTARAFLLAFGGYSALTLLLFHGLFGRFSFGVPHDQGDPLLSISLLWWNAHRIPFVGSWWDGMSFFPEHGSLAFSDHRVGLLPIAGPIQWLGGTPVLAYNVALLSTFIFSALAAHALAWVLTRSHAAGAVAGLVFGFNPFRISHVAHLELLAAFWLPLAFAALHLYVRRYDLRWLVAFALCWWMQGLSSGYYLFYSAPMIGLWLLWSHDEPVVALPPSSPPVRWCSSPAAGAAGYRQIQDRLLLTRVSAEIESFSADVTGLLSATPNMALWRFPSLAANGEAEIYLGVFAPLLVLAAIIWGRARAVSSKPAAPILRGIIGAVGGIYTLITIGTLFGSWSISLGPLRVSASQTVQPLSIVLFCLFLLGITSGPFVDAFRRRSIFAFYVTAAVMTWTFTLGPRPHLLGNLVLYRGPYDFLMLLPGYDARLRVPARFVMITILAVAVAAGIALLRLTASSSRTRRLAITAAVLVAITADSWTFDIPMPGAPALVKLPNTVPASAAVLELPLGGVGPDIAAVYRSIGYERPVVNGYSGYEPPHYRVLRMALAERDDSVLTALTRFAPIAVVIAPGDDPGGALHDFVARHEGAIALTPSERDLYLLPAHQSEPTGPAAAGAFDHPLAIKSASFNLGPFDLNAVMDGDRDTVWATPKPQQGHEEIVLDLSSVNEVSGVSLSTGAPVEGYPRWIAVDTSVDGNAWKERWSGAMGGPTMEAVLRNARTAESRIPLSPEPARFVRLRQLGAHPEIGWFIAELRVFRSVPDAASPNRADGADAPMNSLSAASKHFENTWSSSSRAVAGIDAFGCVVITLIFRFGRFPIGSTSSAS